MPPKRKSTRVKPAVKKGQLAETIRENVKDVPVQDFSLPTDDAYALPVPDMEDDESGTDVLTRSVSKVERKGCNKSTKPPKRKSTRVKSADKKGQMAEKTRENAKDVQVQDFSLPTVDDAYGPPDPDTEDEESGTDDLTTTCSVSKVERKSSNKSDDPTRLLSEIESKLKNRMKL